MNKFYKLHTSLKGQMRYVLLSPLSKEEVKDRLKKHRPAGFSWQLKEVNEQTEVTLTFTPSKKAQRNNYQFNVVVIGLYLFVMVGNLLGGNPLEWILATSLICSSSTLLLAFGIYHTMTLEPRLKMKQIKMWLKVDE